MCIRSCKCFSMSLDYSKERFIPYHLKTEELCKTAVTNDSYLKFLYKTSKGVF